MKSAKPIAKDIIDKVKDYSIVAYLQSKGIKPDQETGNQLLYCSPITNENTASFYVELSKNVFNDFSSGEKGDIISLVMLLEKCSFIEAIGKLQKGDFKPSFSFSGQNGLREAVNGLKIEEIRPVSNMKLIEYIKSRMISICLASKYLQEIRYINHGKRFFAVGFRNDAGGYELRNGLGFKGKTANGITTFDKSTNSVSVFEGFFDFLSALEYYGLDTPNNTSIVLNTTNNLKMALPKLIGKHVINCFLDNDQAGERTLNSLINSRHNVRNMSKVIYPNHKDFNDFMVATHCL